jgi:hypothetical protein
MSRSGDNQSAKKSPPRKLKRKSLMSFKKSPGKLQVTPTERALMTLHPTLTQVMKTLRMMMVRQRRRRKRKERLKRRRPRRWPRSSSRR